jgi:hypothetical protein
MSARVIADSVNPDGQRVTTLQLRYWRAIHAEFMSHRIFSRNASSSRAIPVRKMLAQVWNDPAGPEHWGANQAGMQARGELAGWRLTAAQVLWRAAGRAVCGAAWAAMKLGLHKQVANRLLEPWQFISVVVTATEWENFLTLRDHPDAQPEIRTLAQEIRAAMEASTPAALQWGEWHLPYGPRGQSEGGAEALQSSVARCARVSYLTHDGRETPAEEDAALHDRLLDANPPHMSPAEHQARAQRGQHANFNGWRSYRHLLGK